MSIKILCIGEEWKGSNASAMFYALSRIGCITNIVNELQFISLHGQSTKAKAVNRLVRPIQINDFNRQLRFIATAFKPDVILVYKGAFVKPETIQDWKRQSFSVVNFYPDVSFLAHGPHIGRSVNLYDHIFTTKTFGAEDLFRNFNYPAEKVSFVPHGFDPVVHRRLEASDLKNFECDVSFIGNYSIHKQKYLSSLKRAMPQIDLRIWGNTWTSFPDLDSSIQHFGVIGDLYAAALNASKINLALLSEVVTGASRGDQITSRTFHIPGSGGFMLHQRTAEVLQYFEENKEMACFETEEEMIDKIRYYLVHESEREKIKEQGYHRALANYSVDMRARQVLQILKTRGII